MAMSAPMPDELRTVSRCRWCGRAFVPNYWDCVPGTCDGCYFKDDLFGSQTSQFELIDTPAQNKAIDIILRHKWYFDLKQHDRRASPTVV